MSGPLVEIHELTKAFPKEPKAALKNITATIPKGEIVGLVGPDGAGKTTLIRLIAALLLPSQGWIKVAGKESVEDAEFIHDTSGYMPQRFGLYEDLTVLQNLNLYADLKGVLGEERKEVFDKLLTFTGLMPFQDRLANNLSGGMKQKLGLACALIKKPMLLLLDEPSVGVDPISRRELWKMVSSLLDEGISVLWSTAYLDEAERCDTVLLLNEGELLYHGKPDRLTQRVEGRSLLLQNIKKGRRNVLMLALEQENVIDGTIQGKDVRLVLKEKKSPPLRLSELPGGEDIQIAEVPSRFEDAFIDILGGTHAGISKLAEKRGAVHETSEVVVVADHLLKKFGNFTAVNDISFTVERGEVFGLLGPNGAGKSTTFKMLCGLLKPTSGKARIQNFDLQEAPGQARSHIGYMAQKFSLYGGLDVLQNLNFFSGIYNLRGKRQKEAISKMIEVFDLKDYLEVSAALLPLGFKQRLSLACATMHDPQILFLDEPTSGVDPLTRREFWSHINGLVEKGVTVLITTHFMNEAEYCDRIALIYGGQVINMDTPDALKDSAKTKENPNPTLEEAFIYLIEEHDRK